LAEQAKILVAEAEENNLDAKVRFERVRRWHTCSLCEQQYHGVVWCALGWACWKTYVGRPEDDWARRLAMSVLGNGLSDAKHDEEALSVQEAELSMLRRLGGSERSILVTQGNLACTYQSLQQHEHALSIRRDVYSGWLKLYGEEDADTLREALNYAVSLANLGRRKEAKTLMRKTAPVARRVYGESHELTLKMRLAYAQALHLDRGATVDDLREAMTTLEETARTARRVLGGTHPLVAEIQVSLRAALDARERASPVLRAALNARETTSA